MKPEIAIRLPLEDPPHWLSHIEFTRKGGEIIIQVVKTNDLAYAETRVSLHDFNTMVDHLLDP